MLHVVSKNLEERFIMISVTYLFETYTTFLTPADRSPETAKYFKNYYDKHKPTRKKLHKMNKHSDVYVGVDKSF